MARAATLGKPKEETYVDYSLIFVVLFLLSFGLRVEFYSNNRFIPAGAGNTPHTDSPNGGEAVYPRWRGEHSWAKF